MANKAEIDHILKQGAEQAREIAQATLTRVRAKIGID